MKHFLGLLCMAFFTVTAFSTPQVDGASDFKVWPDSTGSELEKVSFRAFLPEASKATGRAVVILPGGGYSGLAAQHEGYDWAPFFNEQGIAVFVLLYRMPKGEHEGPRKDVNKTLEQIRERAKEWNIDPQQIGIMGSSAGGHLAASTSTLNPDGQKPAFQILLYPVISMENGVTHQGSRQNLLGTNPNQKLVDRYNCDQQVTATTPRAFLALSDDDEVVIPENSIRYYQSLHAAGVPSAMHIYPTGGHGWGYHTHFKYHQEVLAELTAWLKSF